jgi:GH24 family phage-related lysozyme (muramidase)
MSDVWQGATWNENGELVLDIYAEPPTEDIDEDEAEEFEDEDESEHTYATIDCGGECGGCVALIVDGVVVSGPPFHPHCGCSLSQQDIENAKPHKSNLHNEVASDRNADPRDVEWLKKSLEELECYQPDTRAGESAGNPNPYPNQKLFDAIEKFRKLQKIKERGAVKPGHWTEVKINQELEKKKQIEKKDMENIDTNKVTDMKMSDKGIEWLKGLEGSVKLNGKHVIYDDATGKPVPAGVPLPVGATIGYGHLVKPGEDFSAGLTEQQATKMLQQDLQATYNTINEQISADAISNMTQSQYDALVSLVFNIGAGSAAPQNRNRGLYQSTVRKYLNDNKYKSNIFPNLEDAWRAFRNGGILDGRRDAEWRLYNNADYSGY